MAITQREVSDRTFFGKLIKWAFIGFNILMLIWMVTGMGAMSEGVNSASSEAEQTGAAIGSGLGFMFILMIWVFGDIILGMLVLFTRRKKLITVES